MKFLLVQTHDYLILYNEAKYDLVVRMLKQETIIRDTAGQHIVDKFKLLVSEGVWRLETFCDEITEGQGQPMVQGI